jgi:DNA-binding XRE family transcriptional regulator
MHKTKLVIAPIDLVSMSSEDIVSINRKTLLYDFSRMQTENPRMTQEQVAKQLGVSLSTINRHKREMGVNRPRAPVTYSEEQKMAMNHKRQETRMRNAEYKRELQNLHKTARTYDEFSKGAQVLKDRYTSSEGADRGPIGPIGQYRGGGAISPIGAIGPVTHHGSSWSAVGEQQQGLATTQENADQILNSMVSRK